MRPVAPATQWRPRLAGLAAGLALLAPTVGCLRSTSFACATDVDCSTGGTCEAVGYCSFPDPSCATGARFGEHSGAYANQCIATATVDAGNDAPGRCPASYLAIAGQPHRYRPITATASWTTQRDACAADAGYLAIPDDSPELVAIATLAGADTWIGLDDQAAENSFVTLLGALATFAPWDPGQPDNAAPGEDCVTIASSTQHLRDERCSSAVRGVCECEP